MAVSQDFCDNYDNVNGEVDTLAEEFNFVLAQWNNNRRKLIGDRHGICIKGEPVKHDEERIIYTFNKKKGCYFIDLNVQQFKQRNHVVTYKFTITNDRTEKSVNLLTVDVIHPTSMFFKSNLSGQQLENEKVELRPKSTYSLLVTFALEEAVISSFHAQVVFNFEVEGTKQRLTIAREIVVTISDGSRHDAEESKRVYTGNIWPEVTTVVNSNERSNFFYEIPEECVAILTSNCQKRELSPCKGMNHDAFVKIRETLSVAKPTPINYVQYFHLLLWFDETARSIMLKKYNMENVAMTVDIDDVLELEVPGLAEKRPSLIKGDKVLIKVHCEDDTQSEKIAYEGVVTKIKDTSVKIEHVNMELLERTEENPEIKYDIQFVLGRLPYERMHRGVDQFLTNSMLTALFPNPEILHRRKQARYMLTEAHFINKNIAKNNEQRVAVQNILNNSSMEAPYIVFGPPGTGKTITIVEAILQIKKFYSQSKILVCAPANDACDMLALKLTPHCSKKELIRVHSENRETEIPKDLIPYSNYKDGEFTKVPKEVLAKYRIVVATLVLSGRYTGQYKPDYVFIDEAAQALEPEASCAIGLMSLGKQLILAGDPMQLGPICGSVFAEKYKLGLSLLERLMTTNDLYLSRDPRFVAMLRLNFRAHPTVLEIPNHLFYKDDLKAVSKDAREDPIAKIFIYPRIFSQQKVSREEQPVEFCAVYSKEKRQGQSPSYFNELEAETVVRYVEALMTLNDAHVKVEEKDIGIVTPYKRQVYRIKEKLKSKNWSEIEVGTVEAFQGREKRIVIISTVRAQYSLLHYDKTYSLGFVNSDKRFNVALTRAKSKLIVIGCPLVLGRDKNWTAYMNFCQDLNAYFGIRYEWRTNDAKRAILKAFKMVQFHDS